MKKLFLALLVTIVALSGCTPQSTEKADVKPFVVASFYPLYDFARQLCGTNIDVYCPIPPNGDPHSMEATPEIAKKIAKADAVFLIGLGIDIWIDRLVQNPSQTRRIVVSEGIETLPFQKPILSGASDEHQNEHTHHHSEGDVDPHIWMDPVRAKQIVQKMAQELKKLYPKEESSIALREAQLVKNLETLDADFKSASAKFKQHEIVTFHGAFGYLFKRYSLKTAGVIEPYPGDQPSATYLRALVDLTRKLKIKVIFAEPQLPDIPARVIAKEIGGTVERLDPCETILPEAPDATYIERQRKNLETLEHILGQSL